MAKNESAKTENAKPELVEMMIPVHPGDKINQTYLCVNGKNMIVKHGKKVMVPPEFKEVYDNSVQQKMAAYEKQQEMQNEN